MDSCAYHYLHELYYLNNLYLCLFSSQVLCFPKVAVKLITGQEQGSSCIELKLKEVRMKTQIKMTFAMLSIHSDLINATIMSVY